MKEAMSFRSNNFDALRILAAAAVIYGHARPLAATPDIVILGNSVQALAVKIFFVVSGFLVARSWVNDPHVGRYLAKRFLRIFPALLLLLLLTVFLVGPLLSGFSISEYISNSGTWRYLFYNLLLYPVYGLSDLFSSNVYPGAVNGSLWSLPIEFLMYLIFPCVYAFSRVDGTNRLLFVFCLALCALSIYYLRVSPPVGQVVFYGSSLQATLDVAPYFFIGSIFCLTRMKAILDPAFALFLIGCAALIQPTSSVMMELVLYVVLPISVLSFGQQSTPFLRNAGKFGDPSYGLYLYGFLVQQVVFHVMPPGITPGMNALISIPISACLAYFSWHLIEKKAIKLKPVRGVPLSKLSAQMEIK